MTNQNDESIMYIFMVVLDYKKIKRYNYQGVINFKIKIS